MNKKTLMGGFLFVSLLIATLAPETKAFWPFDNLFSKGRVLSKNEASKPEQGVFRLLQNRLTSKQEKAASKSAEVAADNSIIKRLDLLLKKGLITTQQKTEAIRLLAIVKTKKAELRSAESDLLNYLKLMSSSFQNLESGKITD